MAMSFDPRFLWLIVHDLRNPLNVISLTLRLLEETLPKDDPNVREDLGLLGENIQQLERMLSRLSDYSRLGSGEGHLELAPFDPRRLVSELVEDHVARAKPGASPVRFEAADDCPPQVELDPARARLAIQNALTNAAAASEGAPIVVALGGGPERLVVEVRTERAPRETIRPAQLRSDAFERLLATPMERLSLELALAAKVTELFGGTARLDVQEGRSSSVILDWPARAGREG
jgi:K+-sensing histidine kinase KdpD